MSRQSGSASSSGTKGRRSETGEHQSANIDSSSSGGGGRSLGNVHQINWTRGLEYQINLPYLRRDKSSSSVSFIVLPGPSSPSLGAAGAGADASRVAEGMPPSSEYAFSEIKEDDRGTAGRVSVLTMGPPRPCQHAPLKIMGKCGKARGYFTLSYRKVAAVAALHFSEFPEGLVHSPRAGETGSWSRGRRWSCRDE